MSDDRALVPVWALATGDVQVPPIAGNGPMTAERLAELRNVLAALADSPIATLEVHPLPDNLDRSRGIPLDAVSPLAQHLSQLISKTAIPPSTTLTTAGEGLFVWAEFLLPPAKITPGQSVVRGSHVCHLDVCPRHVHVLAYEVSNDPVDQGNAHPVLVSRHHYPDVATDWSSTRAKP